MATAPSMASPFYFMEAVQAVVMLLLIVGTCYMVRKRFKHFKATKKSPSSVVLWIGFVFVAISLLLNTGVGIFLTLFASEVLNIGYITPLSLSFDVFILSAGIMLSAAVIAFLTHEPHPKEPKAPKGKRSTIAERKAADAAKHAGIEVFAGQNN